MDRNMSVKSSRGSNTMGSRGTARDVMTWDVRVAKRTSTLSTVAEIMKEVDCGIVPVTDESQVLAGVVTDRDIVVRGLASGRPLSSLKVEDVMSPHVQTVSDSATIEEVTAIMGAHQIRRLPVIDGQQRLVGMISMSDLSTRADCGPELQTALEKISVPPSSRAHDG